MFEEELSDIAMSDGHLPSTEETPESSYNPKLLTWNPQHTKNAENIYCYCGKDRLLQELTLQCEHCENWFHSRCIQCELGPVVPYITNYHFTCVTCSSDGKEHFERTSNGWKEIITTTLANLIIQHSSTMFFNKTEHIVPFIDKHWQHVCTDRQRTPTWWATVGTCLYTSERDYVCSSAVRSAGGDFTLPDPDVLTIRPVGVREKSGSVSVSRPSINRSMFSSEKRSASMQSQDGDALPAPKRTTRSEKPRRGTGEPSNIPSASTLTVLALASRVTASEHPFNRDGFKYTLGEMDTVCVDCPRTKELQPGIFFSREDRSPYISLSRDRLTVSNDRGFRMIRTNYSVTQGTWYYEVFINATLCPNADPHVRLGWAKREATLQGPTGYDMNSYAYRSKTGEKVHDSHPETYGTPFSQGDVIGCLIHLPQKSAFKPLSAAKRRDRAALLYKGNVYFEEKEVVDTSKTRTSLGYVEFFKNGVSQGIAYTDIYEGPFYPAVSLYRGAEVTMNSGPQWMFDPQKKCQPMVNSYFEESVDVAIQDIVDCVEVAMLHAKQELPTMESLETDQSSLSSMA